MASEAKEGGAELVFHPMDQFIVKPLFGDGPVGLFTVTNVTLWMGLTVLAIFALLVLGTSGRATVPSRMQSIAELAYGFVYKMVEDVAGKDGVKYFPYIMTLFMFIVCANFLGLIPGSFTTTSHIAVTVVMAMAVFLTVTILGFYLHGISFLKLFWISSAPLALRPILAIIEVISYLVRPVSHSVRLAASGGRVAQRTGQEVPDHVAHADSSTAHTCTGQTSADVGSHLYDVTFHDFSPYDGIGCLLRRQASLPAGVQ
jgi:F-type H+-transporting ATPase subunit a